MVKLKPDTCTYAVLTTEKRHCLSCKWKKGKHTMFLARGTVLCIANERIACDFDEGHLETRALLHTAVIFPCTAEEVILSST